MKWLIWKEYRLNRPILILGAIIMLLPYLQILFLYIRTYWQVDAGEMSAQTGVFASLNQMEILGTIMASTVTAYFTLAILGGHAIAGERADRSAEFFTYLPVPRWKVVISKLTIPLLTAIVIFGINLLAYMFISRYSNSLRPDDIRMFPQLAFTALAAWTAFSVGWFLSSVLESPTFAIFGALMLPWGAVMVSVGIAFLLRRTNMPVSDSVFFITSVTIGIIMGTVSFIAGTSYFLRRVEP